jgi:CheY-like chemotaxis protein
MNKKVLVADDQPDSRRLLQDILAKFSTFGVQTFVARNGNEATHIAEKEIPDLLLLDIMMPGMDGFEVCKRVKSNPQLAKTYIIMVSAKIQQEDRKAAALAGADEYLTKPYDVNAVIERVEKVLGINLL